MLETKSSNLETDTIFVKSLENWLNFELQKTKLLHMLFSHACITSLLIRALSYIFMNQSLTFFHIVIKRYFKRTTNTRSVPSVHCHFVKELIIDPMLNRACIRVKLMWEVPHNLQLSNLNQLRAAMVRECGLLPRALIISTFGTMKEIYQRCVNVNREHLDNEQNVLNPCLMWIYTLKSVNLVE